MRQRLKVTQRWTSTCRRDRIQKPWLPLGSLRGRASFLSISTYMPLHGNGTIIHEIQDPQREPADHGCKALTAPTSHTTLFA